MVSKRTWKEFRESGLLWWINMILHTFGWAIVVIEQSDDGDNETQAVYPARVKFRGFAGEYNDEGYKKVSKYMKENAEQLQDEANE